MCHTAPYSGQITLASRNALALGGISSARHSHVHFLKPVIQLLSSTAAKMYNAEPALFLAIPTTTPSIIKSFTFKEPVPTSCLRFKIIYYWVIHDETCAMKISKHKFLCRPVAMACHTIALKERMSIGVVHTCHGHAWSGYLFMRRNWN